MLVGFLARVLAVLALPLAPDRLRADGSEWSSTPYTQAPHMQASHTQYALSSERPPTFTWAPHHLERGAVITAFEINVSDTYGQMVWTSGRRRSVDPFARYPAGHGAPALQPMATYSWSVATYDGQGRRSPVSRPARFHVAPSVRDWDKSSWHGSKSFNLYSVPFAVPRGHDVVHSVTLYICGLSLSSVSLDGHVLNTLTVSPWTNNAKVNAFSSIDLTQHINRKASVDGGASTHSLVVSLGHGWRSLHIKDPHPEEWGTVSRVLRAMVVAVFVNGTTATITHTGDGTWQAAAGPTTLDSLYDGEVYDARIAEHLGLSESLGRQSPHLDVHTGWSAAPLLTEDDVPRGRMVAWAAPPVAVLETLTPKHITSPRPGLYVVDFGVNRAGVCRLKGLVCPRGGTIVLRHAEIMQHAGLPDLKGHADPSMIYTGNLRTAKQSDTYVCAGSAGGESWMPTLTYHGFRFVEVNVSLAPGVVVTADTLEMRVFASAVAQRANVSFSSATLNRLQSLALGAQRSNLMTLPTDCDQRDERLGWMGDSALSAESIAINFDTHAFWRWWLVYDALAELDNTTGSLPDVVPFQRFGGRPADVAWGAALPAVAHTVWSEYGDLSAYAQDGVAQGIALHLANVQSQATQGLQQMHTPYGDWCPPPAKMGSGQGVKPSSPLTSAYSYAYIAKLAAKLAAASGGNSTEAARLAAIAKEVSAEYHKVFYRGNGTYDTGTQTALALALALGDGPDTGLVQKTLVDTLARHRMHYSTGILGFKVLFDVLDAAGRHDEALTILSQTAYPSIGFYFANSLEPVRQHERISAPRP